MKLSYDAKDSTGKKIHPCDQCKRFTTVEWFQAWRKVAEFGENGEAYEPFFCPNCSEYDYIERKRSIELIETIKEMPSFKLFEEPIRNPLLGISHPQSRGCNRHALLHQLVAYISPTTLTTLPSALATERYPNKYHRRSTTWSNP